MASRVVYEEILKQVAADITSLPLQGMAVKNIKQCKLARKQDNDQHVAGLPCVLVSPFGSPSVLGTGTNASDDIGYPVLVAVVQAGNQNQTGNLTRFLEWQEVIRKQFISQQLDNVTEVHRCLVEPRDTLDVAAWFQDYDAGGAVFRFHAREARAAAGINL